MGNTFLIVNSIPLIGAVLMYDLNIALYTGVYLFVESFVLEKVQTGFSQRKTAFIISQKPDLIAEQVMKRLDRGVTFIHASGGWTDQKHRMIYTVINMSELGRLKELMFHHDPDAFIFIMQEFPDWINRSFILEFSQSCDHHCPDIGGGIIQDGN